MTSKNSSPFLTSLISLSLLLSTTYLGLTGCTMTGETKGAAIGATTGAVLGGVIGHQSGRKEAGAAIGAVAGGVLGAIIGKRMDQQTQELTKVEGVQDVKYDQQQQTISTEFSVLFDPDKTVIKSSEVNKLEQLATVLAKYPENIVVIEGHTDSDGTDYYNQKLSEGRAAAIESFLRAKNLNIASLSSVGYGETRPVADNSTLEGKSRNRRVEIKITVDPNRVPQEAQVPG